jgi:hypothetical protein
MRVDATCQANPKYLVGQEKLSSDLRYDSGCPYKGRRIRASNEEISFPNLMGSFGNDTVGKPLIFGWKELSKSKATNLQYAPLIVAGRYRIALRTCPLPHSNDKTPQGHDTETDRMLLEFQVEQDSTAFIEQSQSRSL